MEKRYNARNNSISISKIIRNAPNAVATLHGNRQYPGINGTVRFYKTSRGVFVVCTVSGLPTGTGNCDDPIFAFHIHEGSRCTGNSTDSFADAGMHYNPYGCPHPYHAGDMPPLFSADGTAVLAFLTDRFDISEIIGRTVIIHSGFDDFSSQPSGNAGSKIACGKIRPR